MIIDSKVHLCGEEYNRQDFLRKGFPEEKLVYHPEIWKRYGYNPFSRIDGTN